MKKETPPAVCRASRIGPRTRDRLLGLVLFLSALAAPGAQNAEIPGTVVTGIEALTRNSLVRLTWKDSPEARGPVYIYRSSAPFPRLVPGTAADPAFGAPKPIEVPYGAESYIDDAGGPGRVYYFIAASDDSENRYLTALPSVNTLGVDVAESPGLAAPALETAGPGGISGLEIRPEGDAVVIRYRASRSGNTVLYRSVQPITRTADLLSAVIVQAGLDPPVTDYPVPGIPYYYAVIFEDELSRGNVGIYPGFNATVHPVEITADRVGLPRAAELRSMPLPLISLNYAVPGIDNFSELRNPIPLRLATTKALGTLRRSAPGPGPARTSRAFNQDMDTDDYGVSAENRALRAIVQGPFSRGDWETARAELGRYLSIHHSRVAETRARFYLGQSLYFLEAYREAFYEFLLIRDYYPVEAGEWLEACLAVLVS
ncbi:MAG: hypothetical protein LBO76_03945 [Treponema sp.]|jgi:hypothetical protein|nr:hypothetical protein [Treponema sp.]